MMLRAASSAIFSPEVTMTTLSAKPSRMGTAMPPHTMSARMS
jgi:hypothetical protein